MKNATCFILLLCISLSSCMEEKPTFSENSATGDHLSLEKKQRLENFIYNYELYSNAKMHNSAFRLGEQDTVEAEEGLILSEALLNYNLIFQDSNSRQLSGLDVVDTLYIPIELENNMKLTEEQVLTFTSIVEDNVSQYLLSLNSSDPDNILVFKLFDIVWESLTSGENSIQVLVFLTSTSPLYYGFDFNNCSYFNNNHWWAPYPSQGDCTTDVWNCWSAGNGSLNGRFYGSWNSLSRFLSNKNCNPLYKTNFPNHPPVYGCRYTYYDIKTSTISYSHNNPTHPDNFYYSNNMVFVKFGSQGTYCLNGTQMNQYYNGIKTISQNIILPNHDIIQYNLLPMYGVIFPSSNVPLGVRWHNVIITQGVFQTVCVRSI